jgi:hypothetical protein
MNDTIVEGEKEFLQLPNKKCKLCYGRGFYIGNEIVDGSANVIFNSSWKVNSETGKKEKVIIESNIRKGINPCGCLTKGLRNENLHKYKPIYATANDVQIMVLVEKKATVKDEVIE